MANIINLYSFKLLVVKYKVGKRILVFKIIRFQTKIGRTIAVNRRRQIAHSCRW